MKNSVISLILLLTLYSVQAQSPDVLSPTALSCHEDIIAIAHRTGRRIDVRNKSNNELIYSIPCEEEPTGLLIQGNTLFFTSSYAEGYINAYSLDTGEKLFRQAVGMGTCAPSISKNGEVLYLCNRYKNEVVFFDVNQRKITHTIPVIREPSCATLSKDGSLLFVANFLPHQRADLEVVASQVSVIDTKKQNLIKQISLENGSNALRDMALSHDGDYLFISHNLGRFQVPTSQLQQGWMNTSALSVINTRTLSFEGAVLLDEPESGAAGIWGVACNQQFLAVTHSGTHEFSLIDYPAFIEKFKQVEDKRTLAYQLDFLSGLRKRIKLNGNGPRAIHLHQQKLYIASYFSDQIHRFDLETNENTTFMLNPNFKESLARQGERHFNDATLCFQSWQSCNGCHPGDARTDGLNWDLLNDGIGNPKNCKSLLYAHQTPPSMITGIRASANVAVRAGFKYIQFADVPEEVSQAVDAYLSALKPLPSPYLQQGKLSPLAEKGEKIFIQLNCNSCHSGPYYTDMKMYRIGESEFEAGWDTPTLIEVWRTAPYLNDGRAKDLHELFKVHKHGIEEKVKDKDIEALVEYVNSL